jgi:cytoskeleton protein RodZ
MSTLGERLRVAREQQGISLSQAAAETRILQRYLVALEEGDYANLPGDVYARGFVRSYAKLLDLPIEELIEIYRRERGQTAPIIIVPATTAPRIRNLFVPSFFGVFFVVLMLVGISYLVLNATTSMQAGELILATLTPTSGPTPPPLPTPIPEATQPAIAINNPQALPTSAAAGSIATPEPTELVPTPQLDAPIVLDVRIEPGDNPGSWLEIRTDGETVYQKVLGAGQSLNYKAQRTIWIRAGNAAVVSVTINGQLQPPLSNTPGEVVTFSWPP